MYLHIHINSSIGSSVGNSICIRLVHFWAILMLAPISVFISVYGTILVRVSSSISSTCSISLKFHHPYQNSSSFYVIDANIKTAISISTYNSTSTPSTSTDIRISMLVLIFVLLLRIKQVILLVGLMFSTVIMMLIQKPALLSVRFESISIGHWFFIFVFLLK